ncbi:hypothetical protein KFE25_000864 [Diacronema lutheri]|uniref:Uncharacterized protein n=1 Tax=Diacronema lutheri TaxID=2081491 RepID=A0A8J5XM94_DIALT|nr:hypothetical protein KFE25_000864 [Diacronema lutheri]
MGTRLRIGLAPDTGLPCAQPPSASHAPTQPADGYAALAEDERDALLGDGDVDGDDDDDNTTASAHAYTGSSSMHPPSGAGSTRDCARAGE